MPRPLILEVGAGVDHKMALLNAVASPEVDRVAATTVMGNTGVATTTLNRSTGRHEGSCRHDPLAIAARLRALVEACA